MSRRLPSNLFAWSMLLVAQYAFAAQQPVRPGEPARSTRVEQRASPPAGRISGRVLAADSGRPVKRARVFASAAELPDGRGVLTDDSGAFEFTELPGGRYALTVSKSGFVSLAYGQRRPLQPGTPLQLDEGEQLRNVDFRLPRGSVASGRVYDEYGDAMAGVMVRVLRAEDSQSGRRLVPAGMAQTDDRGEFRIWGLMPGDYYVDAVARLKLPFAMGPGGSGDAIASALNQFGATTLATLFESEEAGQKSYAPTFYPGVTVADEAQPVTLGVGQEALNIDFTMRLVGVARVSGRVVHADGSATSGGSVTLVAEAALERGAAFGVDYTSRINYDGAFAVPNIPPGRYVLRARGDDGDGPRFASLPITVGDSDLSGVSIMVTPGASISGRVAFPPGSSPPSMAEVRIAAPSLDQQTAGLQARPDERGTFTIDAIPPGLHLVRPTALPLGWMLQSVTVDGRDVTDTPIEVRGGQAVSNATVTFTDKVGELSGTITSDRGDPATDYTVLAFTTDQTLWRPQSRHILTARPDQTGRFQIRGLPPGQYYVAIVDPAQQGEWFEPAYLDSQRTRATRVSLGEGEIKTQDFTVQTGR